MNGRTSGKLKRENPKIQNHRKLATSMMFSQLFLWGCLEFSKQKFRDIGGDGGGSGPSLYDHPSIDLAPNGLSGACSVVEPLRSPALYGNDTVQIAFGMIFESSVE